MNRKLARAGVIVGFLALASWTLAFGQNDEEGGAPIRPAPKAAGPYGVIVDRNLFHLVPTPPSAPPPEKSEPPSGPGGLKLTGFMSMNGTEVRAMFINIPSNPTNLAFYNLAEGEREGPVELLKINVEEESAIVINAGNRLTLALKDNKSAGGAGGAPGGGGAGRTITAPRNALPPGATPVASESPTGGPAVVSGGQPAQSAFIGGQSYSGAGGSGVVVSGGGETAIASDVARQTAQANTTAYAKSTLGMINAHSSFANGSGPPAPPGIETSGSEDNSGPPSIGTVSQTRASFNQKK